MRIINTLPEIKKITENGMEPWKNFKKFFLSRHQELIEGLVKTHLGSWDILKEAVEGQKWEKVVERSENLILQQNLIERIKKAIKTAQNFLPLYQDQVEIFLVPSFGFFDGAITAKKNRGVIVLGLDRLLGLGPVTPLVQHEYHHLFRLGSPRVIEELGWANLGEMDLNQVSVGEYFCLEGLASIFPQLISREITLKNFGSYLNFSSVELSRLEKEEGVLWEELQKYLNEKGLRVASKFFMGNRFFRDKKLIPRCGYYLGYKYFKNIGEKTDGETLLFLSELPAREIFSRYPPENYLEKEK